MIVLLLLTAVLLVQQPSPQRGARPAPPPPDPSAPVLDFDFYRNYVEPIFLVKRDGNVACATCHAGAASSQLRLQPLAGALSWTEAQSRQNYEAIMKFVIPGGTPRASRLLAHPLAREAGGDPFHGGGKHWKTQNDPEWQIMASWVRGEKAMKPLPTKVRIIQTNAAGDNAHIIDPATNAVVGIIKGIEIPHGVTSAPDGSRIYISDEHLSTLDVVDAKTLLVTNRIKLSGRPNNVAVSKDGRKVYVGIAQQPGALDVIDTTTLTNVKTIPVRGSIHNVYVTPDGKFAVAGSIPTSTISIVDTQKDEMVRTVTLSAGIRPMAFDTKPDGSTKNIYVQLSNFHGFAVVDFDSGKETARIEHPAVPGAEAHRDGLQSAPAHGLIVTPDGKQLWSTSKVYSYAYVHSLPDLKEIGRVFVGQHPEWLAQTPDGRTMYVAAAGDNQTFAIDIKTLKEVKRIPVGQVPKRNATAILQMP